MEFLTRTKNLIGEKNLKILQQSKILLFGLGGVGGYVLEALVRAGVSNIDIVDYDVFDISNLNRQILATTNTIGIPKVDVAEARAKSINPAININKYNLMFLSNSQRVFDFNSYDYVIDCIDNVTGKMEIIKCSKAASTPIISCMGTGNKLDTNFEITDINKTTYCKLAKIIRKLCKESGINKLNVLYSKESPKKEYNPTTTPATISYVPAVAGLKIAEYVIKDLLK